MKKGKLTDIEIFCIQGMMAEDVNVTDMAGQLGRSVTVVEKAADKLRETAAREGLFINKTASGQEGVTIMTPAASAKADEENKKSTALHQALHNHQTFIHKIRDDEE